LEYRTIDFFIDASTFQVVMSQDVLPKGIPHQIRYSDFRTVNGLLVPFSISEEIAGQQDCLIQLSQVALNTGLADALFEP
jgi:hypothetical protein